LSSVVCSRCGNLAAGAKFCGKCGSPIAPTAAAKSEPRWPRLAQGFGIWWLIIPTAFFAFLRRNIVEIAIVAAIAGALYWWKQQPLPANSSRVLQRLKPFTYGLQLGVVFIMLGGVIAAIALALVLAFVLYVARNPTKLVAALEPWWTLQEKLSSPLRRLLSFAIPGAIGWYIGTNAGGMEWGMTLLSLSIGATIGFLLLFSPPVSLRQRRQ
jgi:hypothetical protein